MAKFYIEGSKKDKKNSKNNSESDKVKQKKSICKPSNKIPTQRKHTHQKIKKS